MAEKAKNPPLLPRVPEKDSPRKLKLNQIRYDGGTQMRTVRNQATIDSYTEKYISNKPMPEPVVFFDGTDYWLADGFQRCEAAAEAKLTTLKFIVYAGGQREAVLYSCGANEDHGLPRDTYAKRRAVLTLMFDSKWNNTNRWIAEACNVSHGFVNGIRESLTDAFEVEKQGGHSALEWAKQYCKNPRATGEEKWGLVDRRPAATQPVSPKEPPIDVPDSFMPDPQHSPPAGSDDGASGYVSTSDESDDDGAGLFGTEREATEITPAEPEAEYRTDRRGNRQKVKPKVKDKPTEEAFDAFGTDDAPDESDGGESGVPTESAIGEPLNELTAPAFAQLQEFADLHRILADVKTRVDALVDTGAGCFIPHGELTIQLDNCRAWIYSSRPHALCPECQGDGCHRCRQSGFIPFIQYSQEQKRQKREAASAA